jgi:hypothetical protein
MYLLPWVYVCLSQFKKVAIIIDGQINSILSITNSGVVRSGPNQIACYLLGSLQYSIPIEEFLFVFLGEPSHTTNPSHDIDSLFHS